MRQPYPSWVRIINVVKLMGLVIVLLGGVNYLLAQCSPPGSTSCASCQNIGFDLGNTSGWTLTTGSVADGVSGSCSSIPACSPSPTWSGSGTLAPLNNPTTCGEGDRFTLYNDPNAIDALIGDPCLTVVSPLGGYSIKLGNANWGCGAERITYTMTVDSCNASFTYAYAVVLEQPGGHDCNEQPFFRVALLDQNGNLLPGSCSEYATSSLCATGWRQFNTGCGSGNYKCWTTVGIDLSPYIGQTITISVEVYDCSLCGHFGYAYFDATCGPMQITQMYCPGAPVVVLEAPPGFSSYQWYGPGGVPAGTGQTITVTNPNVGDVYSVEMYNNPACPTNLQAVLQYTTPELVVSMSPSNCSYQVSGILYCAAPPYTYLWDNGQTTPIATYYAPGTYSVTVTGAGGCGDTVQFTVPPLGLSLDSIVATIPTCTGAQNAYATVIVSGPSPPYTFLWNNGQTDSVATGLGAGTYTVTVTDNMGCQVTATINIPDPPPLAITLASTPASCNNSSDGVVGVSGVAGGTGPYSYQWSNGANTQYVTGLAPGLYTVTVSDANGCSATKSVQVMAPPPLVIQNVSLVNPPCYGDCTGQISVTPSGGTPPYSFSWNTLPVQISSQATGLCAGSYTVTISDSKNCQITATYSISEPLPLSVNISSNPSYCSTNNASASAMASGGTPPYSYLWSNGATTAQIGGLGTGLYKVTVTDANGCTAAAQTSITTYPPVSVTIPQYSSVTCPGQCNGMAVAFPSGGTPPFQFTWSSGHTASMATGLCAGTYSVTVTDQYGCTDQASVTIQEPAPVSISTSSDTTICYGGTATLSAYATGGNPPYSFHWSTGSGSPSITVSPSQNTCYTVSATDANGCPSATEDVCVNLPPPLTVTANPPYIRVCRHTPVTFTAYATGGSGNPITYTWSNGAMGSVMNTVPPPNFQDTIIYMVTASDGCALPDVAQVTVILLPDPIPALKVDTNQGCVPTAITFSSLSQNAAQCIWDLGDGSTHSGCAQFTHTYTEPGFYTIALIAISSEGCRDTLILPEYIRIYALPVADFTTDPDISSVLSTNFTFIDASQSVDPISRYMWVFFQGEVPLDTAYGPTTTYTFPSVEGTYPVKLHVWTVYGCYDDVIKPLRLTPFYTLWIPNVFTPNGDGVNDYFIPDGIPVDPNDFVMYIFDRWGEIIYKTTSMDKPWDGIAHEKGGKKLCQEDVYVWLIITRNPENPEQYLRIIGHVSLLR